MCAKPPSTPSQKERIASAAGSEAILERSARVGPTFAGWFGLVYYSHLKGSRPL
jgi:hypothetical protein